MEGVDILMDLCRFSQQYSHPYIENNFSEFWVKDYEIGFLPKSTFDFSKYDKNLLRQLELYYSDSGYSPFEDRVIIPIYDGNNLVAIASRYPDKIVPKDKKKYINSKFSKSDHFFSKPKVVVNPNDYDYLLFVEGYTDVMALTYHESRYFPLGLMGLSFSDARINRTNLIGKPVVFFLDGDIAGQKTLFDLSPRLSALTVDVFVMISFGGLDPNDLVNKLGFIPDIVPYDDFYVNYLLENVDSVENIIDMCLKTNREDVLIKIKNNIQK